MAQKGRRNAVRSRLENSLCQPNSIWISLSNRGRIWQRKERDRLRLSSVVPKVQWAPNLHCPTAIRLWKTFTYFTISKLGNII